MTSAGLYAPPGLTLQLRFASGALITSRVVHADIVAPQNADIFSITATQGTNAGPANDFCDDATDFPGQPYALCVELDPATASTINACPETLPAGEIFGACDFNAEETSWYTFTAPGMASDMATMDFTYTGYSGTGTPFMNVFEFGPDCSALNAVEATCFQGLNTTFGIGPLTPGQQYLIAISSLGDTGGDFDFTVNIQPRTSK